MTSPAALAAAPQTMPRMSTLSPEAVAMLAAVRRDLAATVALPCGDRVDDTDDAITAHTRGCPTCDHELALR